ncbi:thyrotropin-releasing hormone-degrading ectoenzyme-like isoform X2 [Camponotus floridanus]|nr:thyrotropin-releasing hormone-degrading ectoenzyme-like isoform X2 [Camponotus floridanus]
MAFLKILSYSLIFIVAAAPFIEAQSRHYDIYFVLNSNASIFHGEYNVNIYIPHETQEIDFYTENLSITKITVTNNTQKISKESKEKIFARRPKEIIHDTETYITTISFPYNLLSGNYTLNVKFSGLLTEDGGFTIYIDEENERVWFAATHYQTIATRRLFPLLKDTLYASYNISIKHHKHYRAFSNMPVQEINMDENNMQWTRFKSTPVMPVYFIAVSIAHVALTSETNQAIKLWCRTDIISYVQFAYTAAKDIAQYLDKAFPHMSKGSPETNHIVIPKLLNEEDIKFGFVLYGEKNIMFNEKIDSDIRRVEITRVMGYKVVHEWFYNAIDPYMWEVSLSKGFATFFGIFATDKIFPHLRIQDFFVVQMQHDVLHWRTKNTWPFPLIVSTYDIDTTFEIPSYIKASIMFRSLQIIFTEENFLYGIGLYFKYKALGSFIFFDVMQSVSDGYSMKYNVTARIISWTQLKHYPVINVERNYNNSSLNISVNNFNMDIWIFVNITTQTHLNSKKLLSEVWLAPYISQYTLNIDFIDKNDWILANLQQTECYRVNYDAENWNRLSKYLNSNTFRKIHVLDRAKIIDDTFHFMMTGQLNSTIFFNISHYLLRDKDYIAWYPMFKSLEYMSGFFKFPESAFMKTEILHLLNGIYLEILNTNFNGDKSTDSRLFTECLKQEATKWLCTLNHNDCLHTANRDLTWHLYSHKNYLPNNILTGWKEWTFCNGLKTADNNTWMQVFDRYLEESDHSFLKFLTCSKNPLIILQYIHLMANVTTAVDHINGFCNIVARHARNPALFDFILDSLENIKPKGISFITALTIIINHVYLKQQINKIKEYMEINFTDNLEFVINYEYYENGDTLIKSLPFIMNVENIKMYVNRKLELRRKQIKTELYEYHFLINNFADVLKEYATD